MTAGDVAAFLGAIATAFTAFVAWIVWKGQKSLTERLDTANSLFNQRSHIIDIWDHISALSDIDPQNPATPQVIKAVNTLELVALCYEAKIVDPQIIERTFRDTYIRLYDSIHQCGPLPGKHIDGPSILRENRAAMSLYDILITQHKSLGALK